MKKLKNNLRKLIVFIILSFVSIIIVGYLAYIGYYISLIVWSIVSIVLILAIKTICIDIINNFRINKSKSEKQLIDFVPKIRYVKNIMRKTKGPGFTLYLPDPKDRRKNKGFGTFDSMRQAFYAREMIINSYPEYNNVLNPIGIWYDKNKNKYSANISYRGRKIHLGYFDTEIEAQKERQEILLGMLF